MTPVIEISGPVESTGADLVPLPPLASPVTSPVAAPTHGTGPGVHTRIQSREHATGL